MIRVGVSWGCVWAKGQGAFHVDGTAAFKSPRTGSGSGRPVRWGTGGRSEYVGLRDVGRRRGHRGCWDQSRKAL